MEVYDSYCLYCFLLNIMSICQEMYFYLLEDIPRANTRLFFVILNNLFFEIVVYICGSGFNSWVDQLKKKIIN